MISSNEVFTNMCVLVCRVSGGVIGMVSLTRITSRWFGCGVVEKQEPKTFVYRGVGPNQIVIAPET